MATQASAPTNRADQLVAHVRGLLADGHWLPNGTIPGVRELARQFRASYASIVSVLRQLETEGLLCRKGSGRGHYARTDAPQRTPSCQAAGTCLERVADKVRADFLAGHYTTGSTLPPIKTLTVRYGCSDRILRRALAQMCCEDLCEHRGKPYRATNRAAAPACRSRIYIAGRRTLLQNQSSKALPLVVSMEREMARRGWGAPALYLTSPGNKEPYPTDAAAFVVVLQGTMRTWEVLLRENPKTPVVVISVGEQLEEATYPNVTIISADNNHAGRTAAQALTALGHRHVAFLNHVSTQDAWLTRRIDGIAELFPVQTAGPERPSMATFSPPPDSPGPAPVKVGAFTIDTPFAGRLRHGLTRTGLVPTDLLSARLNPLYDLAMDLSTSRRMQPLFDQALTEKRISAWICVNDTLAALAAHFLRRKGLVPGRDISVIGFDNSPLAYRMGITSYDFDLDRMGMIALNVIASSRVPNQNVSTQRTVEGQLILRESSDRCCGDTRRRS